MKKKKVVIFVMLSSLLWGSLYTMVKIGYRYCNVQTPMDSLVFAGIRFLIVGFSLCIIAAIHNKDDFRSVKGNIISIVLVAFYGTILSYSLTYFGLMLTDSSKSAILKQVGMLLYICFSSFFFKDDQPTINKIAGGVLGFLGIVIMNLDNTGFHFHVGDLFFIGASFSAVMCNVTCKKVYKQVNPIVVNGISILIGALALLGVGFLGRGNVHFHIPGGYLSLAYICVASIIADCLWAYAVKFGSISELYILKFVESGFAAICGAIILGENIFRWQFMLAFALIIIGIYISQSIRKEKKNV